MYNKNLRIHSHFQRSMKLDIDILILFSENTRNNLSTNLSNLLLGFQNCTDKTDKETSKN